MLIDKRTPKIIISHLTVCRDTKDIIFVAIHSSLLKYIGVAA